jgi:hypothetical protein
MKKYLSTFLVIALLSCNAQSQEEPWKESQLMLPEQLASTINNAASPLVICIGTADIIPNSVNMGMASQQQNLDKLKTYLKNIPMDKEIVIYCGCCPFEHCPNIRPAFKVLNEMGFKNKKLLNLPNNIRTDWINKGYPTKQL